MFLCLFADKTRQKVAESYDGLDGWVGGEARRQTKYHFPSLPSIIMVSLVSWRKGKAFVFSFVRFFPLFFLCVVDVVVGGRPCKKSTSLLPFVCGWMMENENRTFLFLGSSEDYFSTIQHSYSLHLNLIVYIEIGIVLNPHLSSNSSDRPLGRELFGMDDGEFGRIQYQACREQNKKMSRGHVTHD